MKIKSLTSTENQLIERMQSGDETATRQLYVQHKQAFTNWVRKQYRQFPEAEIGDVYQESFITFYSQVKEGKIAEIKHSLRSYLFAIGKNRIRNTLRKQAKYAEVEEGSDTDQEIKSIGIDLSVMKKYQKEHQAKIVKELLIQIGEPCKTVLELAFFRRFSPEAIAAKMNYKTEATARVRKVRCLNQMGHMLEKKGINYGQIF